MTRPEIAHVYDIFRMMGDRINKNLFIIYKILYRSTETSEYIHMYMYDGTVKYLTSVDY